MDILARLREALPDEPLDVLRHLLEASAGLSKNQQYAGQQPTPAQEQALWAAVRRLQAGEPLAYVLGRAHFWDFEVKVTAATLIPRPDTEILLECVQRHMPQPRRIIDLGTGSGILALALARLYPGARILAIDASPAALAVARENAATLQLQHIDFQEGNWLDGVASHSADLIVSNPPYLATDDEHLPQLQHEPQSALVAAENGFADFWQIMAQAERVLQSGGFLFLEHGYQQGENLRKRFQRQGWLDVETCRDYGGNERVTWGKWGG